MKNRIIQLLGVVPRAALQEKVRALDHMLSKSIASQNVAHHRFIQLESRCAKEIADLRTALADIAACETPNSNGTVRKMAKIAREALDK